MLSKEGLLVKKKNNEAGAPEGAIGAKKGFGKVLYENRFLFLAPLATAFIMLVVYYCFDLYPFGDITILRMDMYHQYGPLFAEFYDRLTSFSSLLYSWNTGGGSSFLGNYANYVSSPFSFLILLFGHKNMPELLATVILLKSAVASFTFAYYLKASKKMNPSLTVSFGVLYSCSGFFIAYYWNLMWLDAFYIFPLVVLGIEKIIDEGKMKLYIFALFFAALTNYYMAYMICLFSVLYFLAYYFGKYPLNDTYFGRLPRQPGHKTFIYRIRNSRFIDAGVRFALSSLGGVLLAAFILLPLFYILKACSATSGTWPKGVTTYFSVFDFLANHLAYLDPTIRSSGEDVLPNVYCGIFTVMLVPLYLFSKKYNAREKTSYVLLLGTLFASFYLNKLNYIWHGFHFPNDLPYRFSFMYSFILLVLAAKALAAIKEFSARQILGTGVAVLFFAILVQEIGSKNFSELSLWITAAYIGVYVFICLLFNNKKYSRTAVAMLLLCAVTAEYICSNTNNYSMDQPKQNYVSDYDDFRTLKDGLDETEGTDMYRMELTKLRARMDPSWYNYNGVSVFSSMAYEKVANMQSHLGMFGNYINSYTYNMQTPVYNAMFSLKYIVNNSSATINPDLLTYVSTSGSFSAYSNNYWLPVAYMVHSTVEYWDHGSSKNPFEVQNQYVSLSAGVDDVFDYIKPSGADYTNVDEFYDSSFDAGEYYFYKTNKGADASVTYTIKVTQTQNLYLYLKTGSSNVTSITVTGDNDYIKTQSVDTKPYILDLGVHNAGETLTVKVPISSGDSGTIYFYVAGLNTERWERAYNILKSSALDVTEFTDTKISGTFNASDDGILYTSINYDEGWTVKIDGRTATEDEIVKIGDALLGVRVSAGTHSVELKYVPQGMLTGAALSLLTLALMIVIMLLIKNRAFAFKPKTMEEYNAEHPEEEVLPIYDYDADGVSGQTDDKE